MQKRSVIAAVVLGLCGLTAAYLSVQANYFLAEMDFDTAEFLPEVLSTGVTDYSLHPGISPLLAPFAAARAAGIRLWPALQLNMLLFLGAAFASFAWMIRPLVPNWFWAAAGAGLFLLVPGIQQVNSTMSDKVLSRPVLFCALAVLMGMVHEDRFKLKDALLAIGLFMAALVTCLQWTVTVAVVTARAVTICTAE